MEKRMLGRTGHKSTLITLGGAVARLINRKEVNSFIKLALDHGVNHIDVAPTYSGGKAEIILGEWVKEYRGNLFLACKTRERTKREAAEEHSIEALEQRILVQLNSIRGKVTGQEATDVNAQIQAMTAAIHSADSERRFRAVKLALQYAKDLRGRTSNADVKRIAEVIIREEAAIEQLTAAEGQQ